MSKTGNPNEKVEPERYVEEIEWRKWKGGRED